MEAEGNEIAAIVAGLRQVREALAFYASDSALDHVDDEIKNEYIPGRGWQLFGELAQEHLATLDTLIQRVQGMDPGRVPEQPDAFTERCKQAIAEHYAPLDFPSVPTSDLSHFSVQKDGRELLRILPDGTIQRGDAFTTTDEASLLFWQAVEAVRQPAVAPADKTDAFDKALSAHKRWRGESLAKPAPEQIKQLARELCIADGHDPDGPTCDIYVEGDPDAGARPTRTNRLVKSGLRRGTVCSSGTGSSYLGCCPSRDAA